MCILKTPSPSNQCVWERRNYGQAAIKHYAISATCISVSLGVSIGDSLDVWEGSCLIDLIISWQEWEFWGMCHKVYIQDQMHIYWTWTPQRMGQGSKEASHKQKLQK